MLLVYYAGLAVRVFGVVTPDVSLDKHVNVNKYYLDDRVIDFYASGDVSYCVKLVSISFLTFVYIYKRPPKRRGA